MSEFERECEEYGCSPILAQWGNVIDMLMAQTEPKNQKREGKMWEKKWSQICIESGWDNPEKISVALAPKIRDMEKRAHDKLKRHVEGEDKVKWINKRRQTKQEEEYRTEVRLWTKLAITATALSPFKKEEEDVEKLKNQLLKLQLDQARNNGPKKTKQMSQQSVNDPPTPSVIPPYFGYDQGETNHPTGQQGGNWGGNRGQLGGNMGFRGGRGRGGGQQRGVCFVCGSSEHWRNECPSQQGGGQFSGPPARGWGPNRGGPGGRSRGPYTSRYSGQQHPSPANLQAPMHPTWGPEGDAGDC